MKGWTEFDMVERSSRPSVASWAGKLPLKNNGLVSHHRIAERCYLRSATVERLLAKTMESVEMRFLHLFGHFPAVE
jgi:hypothetical protein